MSTKDFTLVNEKIVEFNNSVNTLKSMLNSGSTDDLLSRQKDKCKQISEILVQKFKSGKFASSETMKVQKLSKDFERIFKLYMDLVGRIKEKMLTEQAEMEKQYNEANQRRQTVMDSQRQRAATRQAQQQINEDQESEEEEPDQSEIQEIESINPEIEHYGMMIQEKNNEIQCSQDIFLKSYQEISTEVEEVYKIMEDVAKLTFEQGKQLDVAEDHINTSNSNVKVAAMELESAQTEHKSYKKKLMGSILIFVIIAVVLLLIFFG